jgi:pimeloyl-ACP methyl ester carboxylesterase
MTERVELDVPIQGTTVVIDRSGDPTKPPLVWLHGEFGAIDTMPDREPLSNHLDLIEVHLPGFGVSSGGDRFDTIGDLALAVWWAVEQLGVDRPVLAGHGLGATVAVEMAIQQPAAVRALALATPFGIFDVDDTGVDIFALIPRDLMPHLYADPSSSLVLDHFPPPADAHERGLAAIHRVVVLGAASRYLFPIPDTNVTGRAYRLADVPTSVWFGSVDGVVPPSLAAAWRAALPHATVSVVDRVGHMLPYESAVFGAELLEIAGSRVATG